MPVLRRFVVVTGVMIGIIIIIILMMNVMI